MEFDNSCGMQSRGTSVVYNARQLSSERECHHEVCVMRMVDFSHAIGSTRSRTNSLRVELDSHADTCVEGKNALVIHEHPDIVMVSSLTPRRHLAKRRLWMLPSCIPSTSSSGKGHFSMPLWV